MRRVWVERGVGHVILIDQKASFRPTWQIFSRRHQCATLTNFLISRSISIFFNWQIQELAFPHENKPRSNRITKEGTARTIL